MITEGSIKHSAPNKIFSGRGGSAVGASRGEDVLASALASIELGQARHSKVIYINI